MADLVDSLENAPLLSLELLYICFIPTDSMPLIATLVPFRDLLKVEKRRCGQQASRYLSKCKLISQALEQADGLFLSQYGGHIADMNYLAGAFGQSASQRLMCKCSKRIETMETFRLSVSPDSGSGRKAKVDLPNQQLSWKNDVRHLSSLEIRQATCGFVLFGHHSQTPSLLLHQFMHFRPYCRSSYTSRLVGDAWCF